MVDPGEQVSLTLQREFSEEALNSLSASPLEKEEILKRITKLFKSSGFQVSNFHKITSYNKYVTQHTFKLDKLNATLPSGL